MKRMLFSTAALALLAGTAMGQNPVLTAAETGGSHKMAGGNAIPQGICWYNGDLDFRNGFTSERNTAVSDSWTFDDVDFPGGDVSGFVGNFIVNPGTTFGACDIVVYSGMSEGNFGTQMAAVNDVTDYTFTLTGNNAFGRDEYRLEANLGGSAFNLPAGSYHVGIRMVGTGAGQAFAVVTSGLNAVGTPPGNNGRTFLQSNYFGYPNPTDWQNLVGPGTWDVSYGLVCGGGGGYTADITGTCPGQVTLSWGGADPNRQQGIVFARNTGNFVIPNGPCQGTQLGLGTSGLQLYNVIGTGNGGGSVNANAGSGACRGFVQLIQTHSCAVSNVAQVP
ncbi:MAG: hypothetical protein KJZ69_03850 [Phycisphaerales bacterium]|nr:hypothetical protein [Phycisphaerales bacterium]